MITPPPPNLLNACSAPGLQSINVVALLANTCLLFVKTNCASGKCSSIHACFPSCELPILYGLVTTLISAPVASKTSLIS